MANEIQIATSITVDNGADSTPFNPAGITRDQTGNDTHVMTYHPTDAGYTACGKGGIGNLGMCVVHNLGAAAGDNAIVSLDGGSTAHMTLPYGTWILLWLTPAFTIANLALSAATGKTPTVKVYLWEA